MSNESVNPEFFKAMNNYKEMVEQYLPKPSGCLDSGQPVYNLQDIADHCSVTFEEAEMNLLSMMQQRKELGLSTDGVLINANVNPIQ